MKTTRRLYYIISAFIGVFAATHLSADEIAGVPSRKPPGNAKFIMAASPDLRLLYCDLSLLSNRVERGVCIFDRGKAAFRRVGGKISTTEVHIKSDSTIKAVLHNVGLDAWHGEPQLRLVSRDSIIQSPIGTEQTSFLSTSIKPGDFIVATVSD